jgi:cytochrome c oxidase subunit 3
VTVAAEARRVPPLVFGTVTFLASELTFFGGLFAAYFALRAATRPWPPAGVRLEVAEPAVATAVLVASSVTMQGALARIRRGDPRSLVRWTLGSMLLGAAFVASQLRGYATATFRMSSHAYGSLFFTMTGFHLAHVVVGLLLMGGVVARASGLAARGRTEGVEAVTLYWHFVDAVWLGLFTTIFLIR